MPTGRRSINKQLNKEIHDEQDRIAVSSLVASSFVQGWLTHFAFAEGLPTVTLTERVAQLLVGEEGRVGPVHQLSPLQRIPASATERVQQVEVAGDAHRNGPRKAAQGKTGKQHKNRMSDAGRRKLSRLMKKRWATGKFHGRASKAKPKRNVRHWTMKQRHEQANRMRALNTQRKAA